MREAQRTDVGGFGGTGHAFQGEEVLAVQLGRHLWKGLAHAYIESHLSRMLPKDDSQIDSFRAAASAARRFEANAAAMGCAPPLSTHTQGIVTEGEHHVEHGAAQWLGSKVLRGQEETATPCKENDETPHVKASVIPHVTHHL